MIAIAFEEFQMTYIFFLSLFSFHYQMSIGKRSTSAKIWGGKGGGEGLMLLSVL